MAIDLIKVQKAFIFNTLKSALPHAQFFLFGSRVKRTAKTYSDLDIAIKDINKVDLIVMAKLNECFAESDLPFKVDLVDWQRISPEFQVLLKQEGLLFSN